MSTENIDTMGFEPAVEYDVPDFGKVHVLMKDGEPWFYHAELNKLAFGIADGKTSAWSREWRDTGRLLSNSAMHALKVIEPNGRGGRACLFIPLQVLELGVAQKTGTYPQLKALDAVIRWAKTVFVKGGLPYVVKYNKLEVVFYKGGIYATAPSIQETVGRARDCGGVFSHRKRYEKEGVVWVSNEEAKRIGMTGSGGKAGKRVLVSLQAFKDYLSGVNGISNRYLVLHWLTTEVEPAAKKHLEALKAQEKAEAEAKARAAEEAKKTEAAKVEPKPAKEETPLLLNAEIVPPATAPSAPSSLSYDELLSSWRVTMKAQEATLKEREAILKELEAANAKLKDYEELHGLVSNFLEIHMGNDHDDMECYANIKGLCVTFENWRSTYEAFGWMSLQEAYDELKQNVVDGFRNYEHLWWVEKHVSWVQDAGIAEVISDMVDGYNRAKEADARAEKLEKQLSDAKAALAAKEAELSQTNVKLKEAEEKAACEHNNCDAILAELKAEREAKKELISKYRDTVSENDFLLKALNDRNSLKLVPPYLPPMPLHKAKEL